MILDILNGNNNYLSLNINRMEEYDYWKKTLDSDEVQRWMSHWHSENMKSIKCGLHRPVDFVFTGLEGKPKLQYAIRVYSGIECPNSRPTSFNALKARLTRGDYKLDNWWDKFRTELYEYNGAKSVTGYMINISPKWWWDDKVSGCTIQHTIKHLEQCILEFGKLSNRWKEFHYVIECGKDGTHPHAHIVCVPTDPKSTKGWIKKGNHAMTLRRIFDKPTSGRHEGFVGSLKGSENKRNYGAIQIVSINNFQMYKDKLEYLQEETKPPDHQNKYKVMDRVSIDFS